MSNLIEAKRALRDISAKAASVTKNTRLTPAQQLAELEKLEAQAKSHEAVIETHRKGAMLMSGGDSANTGNHVPAGVAAKGAAVPRLNLDADVLQEAYTRIKGGGNFISGDLGLKDAASSSTTVGQLPSQLLGIVEKRHEPTRLIELIPTSATNAPSVEYVQHSSTTGAAGTVAAGSAMAEVSLNTTTLIATMRKLGVFTTLTDELLADFNTFYLYVQNELQRLIIDAENDQILNGDGTGTNLTGLLHEAGTLTRAKGTETNLDTVEEAINDLRTGPAYCEPDTLILNPTDWSLIRRTKDSYGRYLLGDPGQTAVDNLWGIPVKTTTQIAAGTGILANLGIAAQVFVRQGINIEMTNSSGADFQSGLVKLRSTERIGLGVARPQAINIITGIA